MSIVSNLINYIPVCVELLADVPDCSVDGDSVCCDVTVELFVMSVEVNSTVIVVWVISVVASDVPE